VFRATDHTLDRQVAVKVLRGDVADPETARRRFLWGAQLLGHLEHPHIIRIFDVREAGALAFIVMPLVEGESLAALLLRAGRLAAREASRILAEAADALGHMHTRGVVHRDIKPQHVMLQGPERRVLLIDFTLANVVHVDPEPRTGDVVGTPAYISPELAEGRDLDGRSDLYSLGVVGYEMLTGALPFEGTAQQLIAAHRSRLPRNPAVRHRDIPVDLADVVMRCLAKLPQMRWADAGALVAALRRQGAAAPAAPAGHAPRPPPAPPVPPPAPAPVAPPAALPVSRAAPAGVASPPPRAAIAAPTVPLPAAAPTLRPTRPPATQPSVFRNAPLWVAAVILVLLVGYCAL
jgi:serine/threonine-protein kinase